MAKPKGNPSPNGSPTPEVPPVPAAAIRDSRIGGTISLLCAAAISAQTLFGLGRVIGLSAWTAWLLPAALDVYAMTATRVAFQVPTGHRARAKAIRNARLALVFTTGSNCLYHAMHLAAEHAGWTPADWALITVSALPPIIVERLLHLQSIVNSDGAATVATPATPPVAVAPQRVAEPVAAPATPAPATTQPQRATTAATAPTATPVATRTVAANVPSRSVATGRNAAVATLVPRPERLRIVREMVAERGPRIPLAEITDLFGGDKSTASRLLREVVGADAAPAKAM